MTVGTAWVGMDPTMTLGIESAYDDVTVALGGGPG